MPSSMSRHGSLAKRGSAWLHDLLDDTPREKDFSTYLASISPPASPEPALPEAWDHSPARSIYDEEEEAEPRIPAEELVVEGLIARWAMDEEEGAYIPDVATGIYVGQTMGGPTWLDGALVLNGTSQWADFRNEPNLIGPDHSYLFWARPATNIGQHAIVSKISNTTGIGLLIEQLDQALRVFLDGGTPKFARPSTFATNTWCHVAVVLDAGVLRVYVNGAPAGTASYTTVTDWNGGSFLLGRQNNLTRYFAGRLDDVRVYEVPLSAEDVADVYAEDPHS